MDDPPPSIKVDIDPNKPPPHRLIKTKFNKILLCKICGKSIRGMGHNSGYTCLICSIPIHKGCVPKAKKGSCREAIMAAQFEPFVPVVRENCLQNFQRLLYQAQQCDCDIPKKLKPLVSEIMESKLGNFNPELANKITQLWTTKTVRAMYDEFSQKWQITENADYFFDHVLRISYEGYLPNSQDVLRAKPSTPEKQKSYKDRIFKVWLPKGAKVEFMYNPEETLGDVLKKVREQKDIPEDPPYIVWDAHGLTWDGLDQVLLSQLETLEIYYYPEGTKPVQCLPVGSNKKQRRLSGTPGLARKERLSRGLIVGRSQSGKSTPSTSSHPTPVAKRNGIISVTIHEASNIANNTAFFENLYVIINDSNGDKRYRTLPIPNAVPMKPVWNQTFKFNVSSSYVEFMIKLWATNANKSIPDTMLGQAVVTLESFNDGDIREETLRLRKEPKKFKVNRKQPGGLRVSWQYNDKKLKVVEKKPETREPTNGEDAGEGQKEEELKKTLEEVYDIGDKLGEGAFSVVKAGTHKENGTKVAIKILDNYSNIENAEEDVLRFQQETSIIKSLDHKHIVKMFDIFDDHEHYYVVMELVSGGELFDQIVEKGAYPEEEAAVLILQILCALAYLEQKQICHRDLKPENLIFTDDTHKTLKLIDFGEAKSCADGPIREYVGTTDYMAPEIIKGGEYDTRVDMWSLGVITYVMLCGFPPWEGESESDVFVNIMTLQYDFPSPEWDGISEDGKEFIRALLSEYEDRLTARTAREHPWLKAHAVGSLVKFCLTLPEEIYSAELVEKLKNEIATALKLEGGEVELEKENGRTTVTVEFNE